MSLKTVKLPVYWFNALQNDVLKWYRKKIMKNQNNAVELTTSEITVAAPIEYRTTSTGRPTLVGTRKCSECERPEFSTKKFEKSGDINDQNQRYTLCKNVCVYCYAQKRNKSTGTSLTVPQLEAKIKFYTDLLNAAKTPVVVA